MHQSGRALVGDRPVDPPGIERLLVDQDDGKLLFRSRFVRELGQDSDRVVDHPRLVGDDAERVDEEENERGGRFQDDPPRSGLAENLEEKLSKRFDHGLFSRADRGFCTARRAAHAHIGAAFRRSRRLSDGAELGSMANCRPRENQPRFDRFGVANGLSSLRLCVLGSPVGPQATLGPTAAIRGSSGLEGVATP